MRALRNQNRNGVVLLLSKAFVRTYLQWRELITRLVVVESRRLVSHQSASPLPSHPDRHVAPTGPVEDQRQPHPHLRHRQHRGRLFSPDGLPPPGTTSPPTTVSCGGATHASSAPGTRP